MSSSMLEWRSIRLDRRLPNPSNGLIRCTPSTFQPSSQAPKEEAASTAILTLLVPSVLLPSSWRGHGLTAPKAASQLHHRVCSTKFMSYGRIGRFVTAQACACFPPQQGFTGRWERVERIPPTKAAFQMPFVSCRYPSPIMACSYC